MLFWGGAQYSLVWRGQEQVQVMKASAAELGGLWQLHFDHSSGETGETLLTSTWAGAT